MSILEDNIHLSKMGRVICTITFILGCCCLFIATALLGEIPKVYEINQIEKASEWNLPKKPEETRNAQVEMKPKTGEEFRKRENQVIETLSTLSVELNTKEGTPTKKLIVIAITSGALHPEEALELTKEIETLRAFRN